MSPEPDPTVLSGKLGWKPFVDNLCSMFIIAALTGVPGMFQHVVEFRMPVDKEKGMISTRQRKRNGPKTSGLASQGPAVPLIQCSTSFVIVSLADYSEGESRPGVA